MAKKFNLPPSPRLRRVFSLSSTLVTKELYVQTGTETEALSFADLDKPWGTGGQRFYIDAFGHEEDSVGEDRGKAGQEILDFGQIVFG